MKVFLALLLAHFIADFVTKTQHMEADKQLFTSRFYSKGLLHHCIHHLVISFVLCIMFIGWSYLFLLMIPLVAMVHYFIDVAKLKCKETFFMKPVTGQREEKSSYHYLLENKMTYFIGSQLIHLASLYSIIYIFGYNLSKNQFMQLFTLDTYQTDDGMRILVLGLLFLLVTYPTASFISILMSNSQDVCAEEEIAATLEPEANQGENLKSNLKSIKKDLIVIESYEDKKENHSIQIQYHTYNRSSENPRGRYIGILERILIVVFIVQNLYQGLALIIAMKTLTRFKQFEDKSFAEYYLIGTLLSLTIGLIFAIAINKIW